MQGVQVVYRERDGAIAALQDGRLAVLGSEDISRGATRVYPVHIYEPVSKNLIPKYACEVKEGCASPTQGPIFKPIPRRQ